MDFNKLAALIATALTQKQPLILAIDGRCGAGKTTIAKKLAREFSCNVIHMDDFFLPTEKRTPERLSAPGGNTDVERFLNEVMLPLKSGKHFSYRPYDCHTVSFKAPVHVAPNKLTVIEGSYSCHPLLWDFYDLRIFVDVNKQTQLERIAARNGEDALKVFAARWIPLEEKYFDAFSIKERCDAVVETDK